jgi:hypothetical protein
MIKLLKLGGHVVGVDLSPAMINVIIQKVNGSGFKDRFVGLIGSVDNLVSISPVCSRLETTQAICVSSVLHHLYDYLLPFDQLRMLCPDLRLVLVTHEPYSRARLTRPNWLKQGYNKTIRQIDVRLSKTIRRPAENCLEDPMADYHAYRDGIEE